VTATSPTLSTTTQSATVPVGCPTGTVVVTGGGFAKGAGNDFGFETLGGTGVGTATWTETAFSGITPTGQTWTLTAYAVCATVNP
jgi:hypothetical protein